MSETVTISFEASIALPIEELDACLGDAVWCVQKAIGPSTGAQVISAEADHVDDDERELDRWLGDVGGPEFTSLDELADRELADADRRWPDVDERDSERRYREDPW